MRGKHAKVTLKNNRAVTTQIIDGVVSFTICYELSLFKSYRSCYIVHVSYDSLEYFNQFFKEKGM